MKNKHESNVSPNTEYQQRDRNIGKNNWIKILKLKIITEIKISKFD